MQKDCVTIREPSIAGHSIPGGNVRPVLHETKLKILLVSLLLIVVLLSQFLLRDLDNNRLLSWQWIMSQDELLSILFLSVVGFFAAYKSCFVRISEKREIFFVVAGSYLIGMAAWSVPEFMVDSGRYYTHAKLISTQGIGYFLSEWGYGINAWTDLPLVSIIYGAVFHVFGESRLAIQIVNTGFFSGSVFITFLIGRELWDAKTGINAALMLLAIPFLHVQASQLLVDVPAMFFSLLAICLSIMAVKKPGNGWVLLASAAIVFALLTKYSVWIALTPIVVLPFALKECDRTEVTRRLLLLALATTVLLVFVFYVHHPIILKQLKILVDYQLPAFQRWQESYVSTFFYQVHPLVSLASLVSLYFAIKKREVVYLIPACALGVMLIIGVYRARYLIIVLPMLALVAAFGIKQLKDIVLQRFVVRSAVVVSLAITLLANLNFLQQNSAVNLKNAGQYLNTLDGKTVAAIVLPQSGTAVNPAVTLPILDYYTSKTLQQIDIGEVANQPNAADTSVSPLRFTWEVEHYPYMKVEATALSPASVIILISGDGGNPLPEKVENILANYVRDRSFAVVDRVFRFQSIVTVYRHNGNVL